MEFQNTIVSIHEKLNELNSILESHKVDHKFNIKYIIKKHVEKEKNHELIKFDLIKCNKNLENNVKILKKKLDIEYQVYNILVEHNKRVNKLKEDNDDLPELDEFIESLFDFSKDNLMDQIQTDREVTEAKPKPPKKTSTLKFKSNKSKNSNNSYKSYKKEDNSNPFESNSCFPALVPAPPTSMGGRMDGETLQSQLAEAIKNRKVN